MNRVSELARRAIIAFLCLALTGCLPLLIPDRPPPPTTFDFGPLPAEPPASLPMRVTLDGIEAPSWLDGLDIVYRRLDEQPGAVRMYAQSQWIAAPQELLAQRLRHRLIQAAPPQAASEAFLSLELMSFEQVFEGPDEAYVLLRAHALLEGDDGRVRQREFDVRRPSVPEVNGATQQLPRVADDLVNAVIEWLREAP